MDSHRSLKNLLTPDVRTRTPYNLRTDGNLSQSRIRTSTFNQSFIPFYTKKWNNLTMDLRFIGSLHDFKRAINKDKLKVPKYYYVGSRLSQIIHSRMRMSCSPLKYDLYKMHIIDDSRCSCGNDREDVPHFFFQCPLYNDLRSLFDEVDTTIPINVHNFLFGCENATISNIKNLFAIISNFILQSKRFN